MIDINLSSSYSPGSVSLVLRKKGHEKVWEEGLVCDTIPPMSTKPSKKIESFPNPYPKRDYEIRFDCPEFTCLCPKTGQPDFAVIRISYIPDKLCVELKSLKLYLWSYRDEGAFHEAVTNKILEDLVKAVAPRFMEIEADFYVRGGIHTVVKATHRKSGYRKPKS